MESIKTKEDALITDFKTGIGWAEVVLSGSMNTEGDTQR